MQLCRHETCVAAWGSQLIRSPGRHGTCGPEQMEMATAREISQQQLPANVPRTQVVVEQAVPAALAREPEVRIYAHSRILYWWPVWVCGFVMTALTHYYGQ